MSAGSHPLKSIRCSDGTPLQVRRLDTGDAPALRQFHDRLSPSSQAHFTPHGYDDALIARYVRRAEAGEDRSYVLLDGGGTIVGYFFLWDFNTRVPALGIGLADDYQGRRLGPQMMRILIADARAADRDGIELTTVVGNEPAFAIYRGLDFEDLGEIKFVAADGHVVVERLMFLALKEGATPSGREYRPLK